MINGNGHQSSVRRGAETTGDLLKSTGRLSLAMGLFAVQQTASLFGAGGRSGAAALDEVSDAAGRRLSGGMKSALAIGTNVQSGLVDAALGLAGLGPRGRAATGTSTGLAISLTTAVSRRVAGVRTVSSGALERPVAQDEFLQLLTEYHAQASRSCAAFPECAQGLWKSEGLATSVGKQLLPQNTLVEPALHRRVLPVIHVGFGTGLTAALEFDAGKLGALFGHRCVPECLGFAYEGIGAVLRIYERGFFKVLSGTFGLIRLDADAGPAPETFYAGYLAQFTSDHQRLITHGYGRLIAFSHPDIYDAIEEATTLPSERVEPAVQGIAFATAMMNNVEVARILRHSDVPFEAPVRLAFQNGLVYALVFAEWYCPGLLASWRPRGTLETDLIDHARQEAAGSMARGVPLAFRLASPRC